jgi:cell division inhibitor SepF
MGFLDGFLGKISLNENEPEEEYDGYDDMDDVEEGEEEEYAAAKTPAKNERKHESAEEEEESAPKKKIFKSSSAPSNSKVVPMRTASPAKQAEVCMILPKGYENSSEIAEILLQGKTVVLNMEGMNIDAAQRIIDFTSGACFTMGGNLQKISKKIFIATPSNVELSGDFVNLLGDTVDMASLNLTL